MNKRRSSLALMLSIFSCLALPLHAVPYQQSDEADKGQHERTKIRDDIMKTDERDNTDALAIPLDSSEIEDEEQINRLEDKNVFNIEKGQ